MGGNFPRIDPGVAIQSAEASARLNDRLRRVEERDGQQRHGRQHPDEDAAPPESLSEEELDVGVYDDHGRLDHHDHDIPHEVARAAKVDDGHGHVDRLV